MVLAVLAVGAIFWLTAGVVIAFECEDFATGIAAIVLLPILAAIRISKSGWRLFKQELAR